MLFGDAPRMTDLHMSSPTGHAVHKSEATATHLGPGSYYTAHNENIRAGWIKRSFSNRQPMVRGGRRKDRMHHYTAGVLINGLASSGGSIGNDTPGPGSYNIEKPAGAVLRGGSGGKFNAQHSHNLSVASNMKSTSPRMLMPSASLKDGILFHGKTDENLVGPGQYYNSLENSMVKKSFNARVNSPHGRSPRRSPARHYQHQYDQYPKYSPSQTSGDYSGMYSPRYNRHEHQQTPSQYISVGEVDEAYLYDAPDATPEASQHVFSQMSNEEVPQYNEDGHAIHTSGRKKGRKMGRMSVMENMVPTMFKPDR